MVSTRNQDYVSFGNSVLDYDPSHEGLKKGDMTVSSVSYDFDLTDGTYAQDGPMMRTNVLTITRWLLAYLTSSQLAYGGKKYRLAAQWGDNGQTAYNYIGRDKVCKEELYINAYGDVESQCPDSKDGDDY